jgi:AraC-like DNA-binding protein
MSQATPHARAESYDLCSPPAAVRRLCWHALGGGKTRYFGPMAFEAFSTAGAVLLWVESGSGTLRVGAAEFRLGRGPRFWLFAKDRPRWFTPDAGSELVLGSLRFSGPDLHAYLEALGVPAQSEFTFDAKVAAWIRAANARLWRLIRAKRRGWAWEAHVTLTGLLRHFLESRGLLEGDAPDLPGPLQQAIEALDAQPFRDWRADELAAKAGQSYGAFRRLFREHLHESVHDHLQRRRAEAAQRLLADPRSQIKAIARRLGFASDRYFSYFFRQQTGLTPTEFRRRMGVGGMGET